MIDGLFFDHQRRLLDEGWESQYMTVRLACMLPPGENHDDLWQAWLAEVDRRHAVFVQASRKWAHTRMAGKSDALRSVADDVARGLL